MYVKIIASHDILPRMAEKVNIKWWREHGATRTLQQGWWEDQKVKNHFGKLFNGLLQS